jgi:hypothetical protein
MSISGGAEERFLLASIVDPRATSAPSLSHVISWPRLPPTGPFLVHDANKISPSALSARTTAPRASSFARGAIEARVSSFSASCQRPSACVVAGRLAISSRASPSVVSARPSFSLIGFQNESVQAMRERSRFASIRFAMAACRRRSVVVVPVRRRTDQHPPEFLRLPVSLPCRTRTP